MNKTRPKENKSKSLQDYKRELREIRLKYKLQVQAYKLDHPTRALSKPKRSYHVKGFNVL